MPKASLQLCMTAHALGPVSAGCAHPVVPSPLNDPSHPLPHRSRTGQRRCSARPPTRTCAQYLELAADRGHPGRAVPVALLLEHRALGSPCIGLRALSQSESLSDRFFRVYCSSDLYQESLYHEQFYHKRQYPKELLRTSRLHTIISLYTDGPSLTPSTASTT